MFEQLGSVRENQNEKGKLFRSHLIHINMDSSHMNHDTDGVNVRRALEWFVNYIGESEWSKKKAEIESHLIGNFKIQSSEVSNPLASTSPQTIFWYLYLAEKYLTSIPEYEPVQGARILPVLSRLGSDLDFLAQVGGISEKMNELVTNRPHHADSTLFEFLVAILWKRNGWSDVWFEPESASRKSQDLFAQSGRSRWAIECKRLSKNSEYSSKEREKWLRMWLRLSRWLKRKTHPIVLDIAFHVELETLHDDFVVAELAGKLPLITSYPCQIISNDVWSVSVKRVDLGRADSHLRQYCVKYPSDQIAELIGGYRDPNRGFTFVCEGKYISQGTGHPFDIYLDKMDFAAGAFWHCDAPKSTEKRARDIRKQLSKAVNQLPKDVPGVVHVGLETLDGVAVEAERYQRILNTVKNFNRNGKNLKWIFCHLFQHYSPPDCSFVIDETVYYFSNLFWMQDKPLKTISVIAPDLDYSGSGVHWLRDPP